MACYILVKAVTIMALESHLDSTRKGMLIQEGDPSHPKFLQKHSSNHDI